MLFPRRVHDFNYCSIATFRLADKIGFFFVRHPTCARRVYLFRLPVENPISSTALGRRVMNKTVNAFQHLYTFYFIFFFSSSSFSRNFHITQLSRRVLGKIPNTPSASVRFGKRVENLSACTPCVYYLLCANSVWGGIRNDGARARARTSRNNAVWILISWK